MTPSLVGVRPSGPDERGDQVFDDDAFDLVLTVAALHHIAAPAAAPPATCAPRPAR